MSDEIYEVIDEGMLVAYQVIRNFTKELIDKDSATSTAQMILGLLEAYKGQEVMLLTTLAAAGVSMALHSGLSKVETLELIEREIEYLQEHR